MPRPDAHDLTGRKIGDWTVIRRHYASRSGRTRWMCRCACGVERPVETGNLMSGISKRCRDCGFKQAIITRETNRMRRNS